MDSPTYLLFHVLISVLGVLSGLVVAGGLACGRLLPGWNGFFLATTVLTSVTGFGFPFTKILPPHVVGAISLAVLAVCLFALYGQKLAGIWCKTFIVTAMAALYLNVFVLVIQLLIKTPPLATFAPQGSPAFGVTHLVVLGLMAGLGRAAFKGYTAVR